MAPWFAEARRVVQKALGDKKWREQLQTETHVPMSISAEPAQVTSEAIRVLTLKEAAVRLGITTHDVELMVMRGNLKSLHAGWTAVFPRVEVERLSRRSHEP